MATGRRRQALPARAEAEPSEPSEDEQMEGQREMDLEAAAVRIQSVVRGNQSRWASVGVTAALRSVLRRQDSRKLGSEVGGWRMHRALLGAKQ